MLQESSGNESMSSKAVREGVERTFCLFWASVKSCVEAGFSGLNESSAGFAEVDGNGGDRAILRFDARREA